MKSFSTDSSAFALVATTRYLLLVDLHTKTVVPLEGARPEYYGISWFSGGEDLVLSHSVLDHASLIDLPSYALSEAGFISQGETVSPAFLSAPHQILCAPDDRVICTNTGRNAVSVIDLAKPGHFQEARISSLRWDRLSLDDMSGDHLNSVFEKNGLLYVIAHGYNKGSVLATLSYPDLQVVALEPVKNRTGLHNIWVTEDGQKISCHSEAGALVDLSSNEILWTSGSQIYTRGLAACSEFVLVGETQKSERELRRNSMSAMWLLDRRNWGALDYYCLGPYGAVKEVRLLNVPDEAHHNHPFAGVKLLLTRAQQTAVPKDGMEALHLQSAMTKERIEAASLVQQNNAKWAGFELAFGAPIPGDNGAKKADIQNLCLLTKKALGCKAEQRLEFKYSLDCLPGESHVSVVNYRGCGGDTDMYALLIQPVSETEAHLSLWIQDGKSWAVQPDIGVGGLPLSADVQVHANSKRVEMYLNNKMIISLPQNKLPLQNGSLGIRWLGATIYPWKDVVANA